MPTASQFQQAVNRLPVDSQKLHDIVHGDANTVVTTDNGPVKSIANLQRQFKLDAGDVIDQATALKNSAQGFRNEAEGFKNTALSAAGSTQLAADSALALSRLYPNTTAGLGAVAEGEYFAVAGTGNTYATLYRKVSGAASQIAQYASKAAVDSAISAALTTGSLLLSDVPSVTIDPRIKSFAVAGIAAVGDSGANMALAYDAAVDAAYVAANPATSVIDAAGRGFRRANGALAQGYRHTSLATALASPYLQPNSIQIRLSTDLLVTDYSAIGDGTSHPVSEWIVGGARAAGRGATGKGYANLAELQGDYPDVRSLADEIDYAALNKTRRVATALGVGVYIPPGTYLAWFEPCPSKTAIRGQSSATCTIKMPNGATHSVPNNNDGSGAYVTGVPSVIDLNNIGFGNTAPAISGITISGLTLDGNRANTTVPTYDLFGWGISGTRASDVTISDVIVQNTHCGGIGRFIESDRWNVQAIIKYCGLSTVDGGLRPGFDNNSSSYGRFDVMCVGCGYGARILDNCYGNSGTLKLQNSVISGFTIGDQAVNNGSKYNDLTIFVDGGCTANGIQVTTKAKHNSIRAFVSNITGGAWRTVAADNPSNNPMDNTFSLHSSGCGAYSVQEDGNSNTWEEIVSDQDGASIAQGGNYAVDVYGSDNRFNRVTYRARSPWTLRGIAFRSGAKRNRVANYNSASVPASFWDDADGSNVLILTRSSPQSAANVVLDGWGAAATVTAISGTDTGGSIWITASGAGRAQYPTVTIYYADGNVPAGKYTLNIDTNGGNGIGAATDSRQVLTDRLAWRYRGNSDGGTPADGGSYLFTWSIT